MTLETDVVAVVDSVAEKYSHDLVGSLSVEEKKARLQAALELSDSQVLLIGPETEELPEDTQEWAVVASLDDLKRLRDLPPESDEPTLKLLSKLMKGKPVNLAVLFRQELVIDRYVPFGDPFFEHLPAVPNGTVRFRVVPVNFELFVGMSGSQGLDVASSRPFHFTTFNIFTLACVLTPYPEGMVSKEAIKDGRRNLYLYAPCSDVRFRGDETNPSVPFFHYHEGEEMWTLNACQGDKTYPFASTPVAELSTC